MIVVRKHPDLDDLTKAVIAILDRCSRTQSSFTHRSVTECIQLDHPKWIFSQTDIEIIINELFLANKIKGKVVDLSNSCGCKGNCFCLNYKEVLYKQKIVSGDGEYNIIYCLESD
jgi:hypothetical protein